MVPAHPMLMTSFLSGNETSGERSARGKPGGEQVWLGEAGLGGD